MIENNKEKIKTRIKLRKVDNNIFNRKKGKNPTELKSKVYIAELNANINGKE